ncbi:exosporium protein C [Paenibacillus zeisoli]|uniref:Exosporium protein C n=1 Tax=Paenibacillus zeisoli TaxID=2496267 RepID=A0A3S1B5T9_9BACL|nr:exosporium protein C [Paenibacillus zeisoli]RUT31692.1 exosporium protein C [Paenibacillus zeisoli]
MAQILAYSTNVPTPITDGAAITVPLTPAGQGISQVRIVVPPIANNRVELVATVGFRGDLGTGSILFRIFRDGHEIYYARQGFETSFEKYYLTTLQAIDPGVVAGTHDYTLSVELLTPGTAATVIGPITFSALAIEL